MYRPRGLSLPEVLIVLVILSVLLALAIPQYQGVFGSSQAVVARNLLETLNSAVHRFGQGNGELVITPFAVTTGDEYDVLRRLQWRNPDNPRPGSPYMRPDWNPEVSSNTADYRLRWEGTLYALVPPGTSGTGFKVIFDGSDITTPFIFPPGYNPGGK
nr:prepilin-type N-terminal cleavage/methylation domain-containing protein [Roseimicrobium gellanilyticum]